MSENPAASVTLHVTTFDHLRANRPDSQKSGTWEAFASELEGHVETDAKEDVPLFCFARFKGDTTRASANVLDVWGWALDLDKATQDEIATTIDRLKQAGIAFAVYSTHSHTSEQWKYRIVGPLAEPVPATKWPATWRAIVDTFAAGLSDEQCKDASRIYYWPSCKPGAVRVSFSEPGEALDASKLKVAAPAPKVATRAASAAPGDYTAEVEAIAALLRPHWHRGKRNELRLKTSGMLKHAGWPRDAAEELLVGELEPEDSDVNKARATVGSSYNASACTGYEAFAEALGDRRSAEIIRSIARSRETELDRAFAEKLESQTAEPVPRATSPFVDIFAEQPDIAWIVQGIDLAPGPPTIVAGFGFSGKTLACQSLAMSIASGRIVWGTFEGMKRGEVLHLDYEQGQRLSATRYQRLARGLGVWAPEVAERLGLIVAPPFYLDQAQAEEKLIELCAGKKIVLIDSLRAACPSIDENSSDARRPLDMLFRVSERTGAAFVVIHHAGKSSRDKSARERLRGSSALFDACQSVLIFEPQDDGRIRVEQTKARLSGTPVKPFDLKIEDVADLLNPTWGLTIKVESSKAPSTGADKLKALEGPLLAMLATNPQSSTKRLSELVEKRQATVASVLEGLEKQGLVFHYEIGATKKGWELTSEGCLRVS